MAQSKPRPGPWFSTPTTGKYGHVSSSNTLGADCGGDIAVVWGVKGNAEADARLIAAAPELLAALTRVVEAHGPFGDDTRPTWWADACAAIAKAEGGAA